MKNILTSLLLGAFLLSGCVIVNPPSPPTPPTPTPTPTPAPPIVSCSFPQGVPDEGYVLVPNPLQFQEVVNTVVRENTTCSGETDCVWGSEDPQKYIEITINELQRKGLCAGQHVSGVTDQVSVAAGCEIGVVWENYYVVNYGGVQHKARFNAPGDGWKIPVSCTGTVPPVPTPTPTPTPTPGWSPPPPLGLILAHNAGVNRPVIDATPKTKGTPEWCALWSTGGQNCPGGTEANPGQRQAVEAIWGAGPTQTSWTWTIDGSDCLKSGACFLDGGNPLRIVAPGAWGKVIRVTGGNGVFVEVTP